MTKIATTNEHPFAQYIRILGKGKSTARSLSHDEAQAAFTHVLQDEVTELQLGAFLMLLRVKGEDAHEMSGFAKASKSFLTSSTPSINIDIDWPSYAGKKQQQHWYLLAALLLAQNGFKIFMHGSSLHTDGRSYSEQILSSLDVKICQNWNDVESELKQNNFSFSPLKNFCPELEQLFQYRNLLGVRSPVHSFIKMINPLDADTTLQSVFHPAYLPLHQQATQILEHKNSVSIKGQGGEFEYRPDADHHLYFLNSNTVSDECLFEQRWKRKQKNKQEALDLSKISAEALLDLWKGKNKNNYDINAVIGTVALVLAARDSELTEEKAWQQAEGFWQQRDKNQLF